MLMCSSEGMADGGESVRLKLKNKKVSKELVVANPLSQKNGSDINCRNDSLYIGLQKKDVQQIT